MLKFGNGNRGGNELDVLIIGLGDSEITSMGLAHVLSPGVKAGNGERRCGDSIGKLGKKLGLGFPNWAVGSDMGLGLGLPNSVNDKVGDGGPTFGGCC